MPSSQGSQVKTLIIELLENLLFNNDTMPEENSPLCSSLFFIGF
jgi:hypothetical protein